MKDHIGASSIVIQPFFIATLVLGSASFCNSQKANSLGQANIDLITICRMESDLQFLSHVAVINMEEILLGQLAQQKSKLSDVQELGKIMEETHGELFMELKELAKKKNLTIPIFPTHKARWTYNKFKRKSQDDFDKAYCDLMVEEHRYAIALFEKEFKKSTDEEVTKWIVSKLPTLRTHLIYSLNCQLKCKNALIQN